MAEQKNDDDTAPFLVFVKVKRVIGATTIMIGVGLVKLLGVNTLETQHPKKQVDAFGKEASEFTQKMVEGKLVRIELDRLASKRDEYSRTGLHNRVSAR
jgi:micrococcal nuclease